METTTTLIRPTIEGLLASLVLIGKGEITEKAEYHTKGDRLMYVEYLKENSFILVVHARFAASPYGGEKGYNYEIIVCRNDPKTVQFGGGYGASGIMGNRHTYVFHQGNENVIHMNAETISKECNKVKALFA